MKSIYKIIVVCMVILSSTLACLVTIPGMEGNKESASSLVLTVTAAAKLLEQAKTNVAQSKQNEPTVAKAESTPAATPGEEETNIETNFSSDDGYFTLGDKMVIEDDGLFMGEFEKCADFSLEIDRPVDCIAICKGCGIASEYDERVEITYTDGYVDKMFGLVIRFDDKNDNNMIDRDEYFLGWAYNAYPQPNASYLFEHIPADFAGWKVYGPFPRHLRGKQDKPSIIRVTSWHGGSRIIIYMNDTVVAKIQNEEKIPGKDDELFLGKRKEISSKWEGMPNEGKVGFWVAEWKIQLKYDNFTFSNNVEEPEDW